MRLFLATAVTVLYVVIVRDGNGPHDNGNANGGHDMMTETEWYETYGECEECETVEQVDEALAAHSLWAHVEGDDDEDGAPRTYLLAGYHRVNVIRYVRTERSWPHVDVPVVLVHDMP